MKKMLTLALAILCAFMLAACGCEHVWEEATCLTPKTCTECEETEGSALGHDWLEADCMQPMRCGRCGFTAGDPLGHEWQEADCENDKVCTRCALVEAEALGHDWQPATCDTPETCARCALTQGDVLEHVFTDWLMEGESVTRSCTLCNLEETSDPATYLGTFLIGHWDLVKVMGENGVITPVVDDLRGSMFVNWGENNQAEFSNGTASFKGEMKYHEYQEGASGDLYWFHFDLGNDQYSRFAYATGEDSGLYYVELEETFLIFTKAEAEETVEETTEETVEEITEETQG